VKQRDRAFLTHLTWSGVVTVVVALVIGVWIGLPLAKKLLTPRAHIVLQLETTKGGPEITSVVADQVISIIRRRVEALGISEPSISTIGNDRIVVDVRASAADAAKLRSVLAERDVVEFKICPGALRDRLKNDPTFAAGAGYDRCGAAVLTGADLRDVQPGFGTGGEPQVDFTTRDPIKFGRVSRDNIGRLLVIFIDRKYVTGATIEAVISGSGLIHGTFTEDQVATIARQLNAGTLPVPVRIIEPT
jgi:preprotein translocase subunit SecD